MPTIRIANIDYPVVFRGGVFCHPDVNEDLEGILEHAGCIGMVRAKLEKALEYLDENGRRAVQHREWFEKLKGVDDMFSLHVACVANIRILYVFFGQKPILLYAFSEKAKATARAKSYATAIPFALKRMGELNHEA